MPAESVRIEDPTSGSAATILVGLGFNCFSWKPALSDGPREMLWAKPGFETGEERPSSSGIPLLFPFPGRIGGGEFAFNGKSYNPPPGDPHGNAIHGFVFDRAWRLVDSTGDTVTAEFQGSIDAPETLAYWPSDYRIRASYNITGTHLVSEVVCSNEGEAEMPFGFGTHAYFRLPLSEESAADDTVIRAPVDADWALENMLPVGKPRPLEPSLNLAEGVSLAGREFDTPYRAVASGGQTITEVIDGASRRRLRQTTDDSFPCCVIYTPGHREAVCLEPYSCVPDAVRLTGEGQEVGLRVLAPGESWQTEWALEATDD